MKTLNKILPMITIMVLMLLITACSTTKAFTFNIENGDKIKVKLDTTDDYNLKQEDGRFTVVKGDEDILQGIFVIKDAYDQYLEIKESPDVRVIEDTQKDGNTYFFYEVEGESGTENNFVLWIKDANTGLLLGSFAGEAAAKEAFDRLDLTLD